MRIRSAAVVFVVVMAIGAVGGGTANAACIGANVKGNGTPFQGAFQRQLSSPRFNTRCLATERVEYESTSDHQGLASWWVGHLAGEYRGFGPSNAFIATDRAPNASAEHEILEKGPGAQVLSIPVFQTAVALPIHLPEGCRAQSGAAKTLVSRLVLSDTQLQGIFAHTIRTWAELVDSANDYNHDALVGEQCHPQTPIVRVVRQDASGTTAILKKFLFQINKSVVANSETWSQLAESAETLTWPAETEGLDRAVAGSGVAGKVAATPGSIGYANLKEVREDAAFTPAGGGGEGESISWAELQRDGARYADPSTDAESNTPANSNCADATYTNGTAPALPASTDPWNEITATVSQTRSYALCGLTYDLSLTNYLAFSEEAHRTSLGEAETVRSYLEYILSTSGQGELEGHDVTGLPTGKTDNLLKVAHEGAAAIATSPPAEETVTTPTPQVLSATNQKLTFRVLLPPPHLTAKAAGGTNYVQINQAGMGENAIAIGSPRIPLYGTSIAVPIGAKVAVKATSFVPFNLQPLGSPLYPVQPAGADGVRGRAASAAAELPPPPPPFTINREAYASSKPVPATAVTVGPAAPMRTLQVATLSVYGGRYVPKTNHLTMYKSLIVTVTFSGAKTAVFGTSRLTAPPSAAFDSLYAATVLNWPSVPDYLAGIHTEHAASRAVSRLRPRARRADTFYPGICRDGLVITSPALDGEADRFAGAQNARGISTGVFTTAEPAVGDTATSIRNFISNAYHSCYENQAEGEVYPEFVTIIGDTTQVPTFEVSLGYHGAPTPRKECPITASQLSGQCPNFFEDPIASDQPYAFIEQEAEVNKQLTCSASNTTDCEALTNYHLDLLVGRLPAANANQADAEITAADTYMTDSNHSWATTVTGAEFFQPCGELGCGSEKPQCVDGTQAANCGTQGNKAHWPFMNAGEEVFAAAQQAGYGVCRVGADEEAHLPGFTIKPAQIENGNAIPNGVNWGGNHPKEIEACVDTGHSVFVYHSDHGYVDGSGWYEPGFGVGEVAGLAEPGDSTGEWELPVVWSSDCDSGKFDHPTEAALPDVSPGVSQNFGEAWLEDTKAVGFIGASRESPIINDAAMLSSWTNHFPWFVGAGSDVSVLLGAAAHDMLNLFGESSVWSRGTFLEYNLLGAPDLAMQ